MSQGLSRSGSVTALKMGSISLTRSTGIGSTNWLLSASLALPCSHSAAGAEPSHLLSLLD